MSGERVFDAMNCVGIPIARGAWPKDKAPNLPWAVYRMDSVGAFEADDVNYAEVPRWEVDLYQKTVDPSLEQAIEEAITNEFGPYERYEQWMNDENCMVTVYLFKEWRENG